MSPTRPSKGRSSRSTRTSTPTSSTKPRAKKGKKGKSKPGADSVGSLEELLAAGQINKDEWMYAPSTTEGYDGYIRRGKLWLAKVVDQSRQNPNMVIQDDDGNPLDLDEFSQAFSRPPNQYSAHALHLFLIEKCVRQGLGPNTCDSVYSAFKKMWNMMDNERYRGPYSCDHETHTVRGNPADSAVVQDTRHALINKGHAEGAGNRDHAEAMRIEDLEAAMRKSMSRCPDSTMDTGITSVESLVFTWNQLLMRGSAAIGFVVWTRVSELLALQEKHYRRGMQAKPYDTEYDVVRCELRKGWTRKEGGTHAVQGHNYQIYEEKDNIVLDAFTRLRRWRQFYVAQIHRELEEDDYLFPYISTNGIIHPKRPMDSSTYQKLLAQFMLDAGIQKIYSTHSFRRGGAQYRFMFCDLDLRWSLIMIRWWGGWAEGESSDTLIRYLMDELHAYEHDFSDALSPMRREARESFTSVHTLTAAVTTAEFRQYASLVNNKMTELTSAVDYRLSCLTELVSKLQLSSANFAGPSPLATPTAQPSFSAPTRSPFVGPVIGVSAGSTAPSLSAPNTIQYIVTSPATTVPSTLALPTAESAELRPAPPVQATIPDLPKPLKNKPSTAWKVAIDQWLHGDPANGLHIPLKDWPAEWYSGAMSRFTGAKYGQRKDIAQEYERLGSNDEDFLAAYPKATEGVAALRKEINKAREERGELTRRRRG